MISLSRSMRRGLLALAILASPAPLIAQDQLGDWARVIRHRDCPPADSCPPRRGMVWDSSNAAPAYPEVLRAVGIGGDAEIAFHVRADGTVDPGSVTAVHASHPVFQQSAIEAARRWRFGTELTGRPAEAIPLRMELIFAHLGACASDAARSRVGHAAAHQLVIAACTDAIPRAQVHAVPESLVSLGRRFAAPITGKDSVAVARQLVRAILSDPSRFPDGIVPDAQGSPWHRFIATFLAGERPGLLVPPTAAPGTGTLLTVLGAVGSAVIEVGWERCDPATGLLHAEVRRYLPRSERDGWSLVALPNALIASGKCPSTPSPS